MRAVTALPEPLRAQLVEQLAQLLAADLEQCPDVPDEEQPEAEEGSQ